MPWEHDCFVYLLTNARHTVLSICVTHDLEARLRAYCGGMTPGFTEHYQVNCLVYNEAFGAVLEAMAREKQLKGWTRAKKEALVARTTPRGAALC